MESWVQNARIQPLPCDVLRETPTRPIITCCGDKITKETPDSEILNNRAVIYSGFHELEEKSYGKPVDNRLELSFVEALYLLEKENITVKYNSRKTGFRKLIKIASEIDPRIHQKYVVYKDLRDRGLVVKTGFKFGCDFRVYKRGVKVKKGPKKVSEHTKWIVHTASEDYTCSFAELSRAVRLAHSIRAKMLWAIVDNENNVTYYQVIRTKP